MLKPDQWPHPRDSEEAQLVDGVKRRGAQVVTTPYNLQYKVPDYAHSVGFYANFGRPEVIVMGVSADTGVLIITELCRRISQGMELKENEVVTELLEGRDFLFAKVDLYDALDHVDWLLWFYTPVQCSFPLMQALWADKRGRFPVDPECDREARKLQTIKRFLKQAEPGSAANAAPPHR
jgi:hypothetical protein